MSRQTRSTRAPRRRPTKTVSRTKTFSRRVLTDEQRTDAGHVDPDFVPSVEERLDRARRTVNLAAGALDGYDAVALTGGDVEQLVSDVRESLRPALLDLYWLSKLGADVLTQPAPGDESR